MDGDATTHIPQIEPQPIPELITGPVAETIAALRERIEDLEARDQVYQTITTGFAAMLGQGQYALPFAAFDNPPGGVIVEPVEDAQIVVYYVQPAEASDGE